MLRYIKPNITMEEARIINTKFLYVCIDIFLKNLMSKFTGCTAFAQARDSEKDSLS